MSAVATFATSTYELGRQRVSVPRAEIQIIARFGPEARNGLDVSVLGARERAHRKFIPGGHRTVAARLHLGSSEAVLGASAGELAGRIVPLEHLWGAAATAQLCEQLASGDPTAILERAIAERVGVPAQLVLAAAERLATSSVHAVASELGLSERHLRRVFGEAVGMSPKVFARLSRFHRALHAARDGRESWARVAASTGYGDQAHLIDEFRAIAGATPRVLVDELAEISSRACPAVT